MFDQQFLHTLAASVAELVVAQLSRSSAPNRLMDVAECADYIGKTKQAVYHMASSGKIPCKRIGSKLRFDRKEIDEWIDTLTE